MTSSQPPLEIVADEQNRYGESPCWDAVAGRLLWVDNFSGDLYSHVPATRTTCETRMKKSPNAMKPPCAAMRSEPWPHLMIRKLGPSCLKSTPRFPPWKNPRPFSLSLHGATRRRPWSPK